jgi:hypothetical protein
VFERRADAYVAALAGGAVVHDSYPAGDGRTLVVRTAALREVRIGAIVHVVDARAPDFGPLAAAMARAAGGEFTATLHESMLWRDAAKHTGGFKLAEPHELAAEGVLQFHLGRDLLAPTPSVCEQIVAHMVRASVLACASLSVRSLAIPAWFRLADAYGPELCLRDLFTHTLAALSTADPPLERVELLLPDAPALLDAAPGTAWPPSIREHAVVVDWTAATAGHVGRVPFPLRRHPDVRSWLEGVQLGVSQWTPTSEPHGVGWQLRDPQSGADLTLTPDDRRAPADAGLVPGRELAAVLLPRPPVAPEAAVPQRPASVVISGRATRQLHHQTAPLGPESPDLPPAPHYPRPTRYAALKAHEIGRIDVLVARGDLCLERTGAVVVGMSGTYALDDDGRRVREFAGPAAFDPLVGLPRCAAGDLFALSAGRLAALWIFLVVHDAADGDRAGLARAVERCFRRAAALRLDSLTLGALFGSPPAELAEVCLRAADACLLPHLQTVHVVERDGDAELTRAGGQVALEIDHRYVLEHARRQRFVLGRHTSVLTLIDVIFTALPLPIRPPPDTYGDAWLLRRRSDGWILDAKLAAQTPQAAGIRPNDIFEFVDLTPAGP